jgi:hypothetical protein
MTAKLVLLVLSVMVLLKPLRTTTAQRVRNVSMVKSLIATLATTVLPMNYPSLCAHLVSTTLNQEENPASLALLAHTVVTALFGVKWSLLKLAQEAFTAPVELYLLINSLALKEDTLGQMTLDCRHLLNVQCVPQVPIAIELVHLNTTHHAKTDMFVVKVQPLS